MSWWYNDAIATFLEGRSVDDQSIIGIAIVLPLLSIIFLAGELARNTTDRTADERRPLPLTATSLLVLVSAILVSRFASFL